MLEFKGVLIDFYWTLAYGDRRQSDNYLREAASILAEYGYDRNVDEVSAAWIKVSRESKTGDIRNMHEFLRTLI